MRPFCEVGRRDQRDIIVDDDALGMPSGALSLIARADLADRSRPRPALLDGHSRPNSSPNSRSSSESRTVSRHSRPTWTKSRAQLGELVHPPCERSEDHRPLVHNERADQYVASRVSKQLLDYDRCVPALRRLRLGASPDKLRRRRVRPGLWPRQRRLEQQRQMVRRNPFGLQAGPPRRPLLAARRRSLRWKTLTSAIRADPSETRQRAALAFRPTRRGMHRAPATPRREECGFAFVDRGNDEGAIQEVVPLLAGALRQERQPWHAAPSRSRSSS